MVIKTVLLLSAFSLSAILLHDPGRNRCQAVRPSVFIAGRGVRPRQPLCDTNQVWGTVGTTGETTRGWNVSMEIFVQGELAGRW